MKSAREGGRPSWKTGTALGAKVLLSLLLISFLFRRISFADVAATLRSASPRGLWVAGGLLLFSNLLGAYQWSRLLRVVEIRIPFWKVLAYYHVGLFFNNFLPANVGGDFARVLDSSRYGPTKTAALSAVLMDRLIGTAALGGLATVTTLPAIDHFHLRLAYLGVVAFFAVSVTLLWAVFHPALLPALERVLARIGLGQLGPHLDDLAARMTVYRGQRRLLLEVFLVATVVQVSRIGVHVLVARALGMHVALAYFFLFVPLLAVIVSLPISLNGIGVREGAGIMLFNLAGVDPAHAFSLQFTTYLVAVAVSLLGGVVFLVRIPHRRAEARATRRQT